jgi:hypothetical protein
MGGQNGYGSVFDACNNSDLSITACIKFLVIHYVHYPLWVTMHYDTIFRIIV